MIFYKNFKLKKLLQQYILLEVLLVNVFHINILKKLKLQYNQLQFLYMNGPLISNLFFIQKIIYYQIYILKQILKLQMMIILGPKYNRNLLSFNNKQNNFLKNNKRLLYQLICFQFMILLCFLNMNQKVQILLQKQ
ncbi:hypothetical protein IMG5_191050 [Ichthyophthirius multifiliis]|uniref:Transmembrane protein n=1 Tax=Ichthyophthirius multifiliis TaxID=5932 RepID=G0R4B9_ICHMU|nr:hypothetical protein IMG5_191050 [Ichthyophthirius multifiliis]EGR27686.1 hypothetical protein IMG5_191050 [Ichthyophthirius multifiliis]|eukprot:XP_004025138.1 hypothetical protein IMG5_191050 [Ichthyophthirius multifiliis]